MLFNLGIHLHLDNVHEVENLLNHATDGRGVLENPLLTELLETQAGYSCALLLGATDDATLQVAVDNGV